MTCARVSSFDGPLVSSLLLAALLPSNTGASAYLLTPGVGAPLASVRALPVETSVHATPCTDTPTQEVGKLMDKMAPYRKRRGLTWGATLTIFEDKGWIVPGKPKPSETLSSEDSEEEEDFGF